MVWSDRKNEKFVVGSQQGGAGVTEKMKKNVKGSQQGGWSDRKNEKASGRVTAGGLE